MLFTGKDAPHRKDTPRMPDENTPLSEPRYPDVIVALSGTNGNGMSIMLKVAGAMRRRGISDAQVELFQRKCMESDYNALLRTCMAWVTVR